MKAGLRKGCRACVCGLLAAVLLAAAVGPAYATKKDVEDAKKRASSLETEKKKVEARAKTGCGGLCAGTGQQPECPE